jgi:hypothetical protein
MGEELEKQAQEKLAQARQLIKEAGALAKEGQFVLHFGEIGTFIPRAAVDPSALREKAIEILKDEEESYGYKPWDSMNDDEREDAIGEVTSELSSDLGVPYQFREYGYDSGDADRWWHPSRC